MSYQKYSKRSEFSVNPNNVFLLLGIVFGVPVVAAIVIQVELFFLPSDSDSHDVRHQKVNHQAPAQSASNSTPTNNVTNPECAPFQIPKIIEGKEKRIECKSVKDFAQPGGHIFNIRKALSNELAKIGLKISIYSDGKKTLYVNLIESPVNRRENMSKAVKQAFQESEKYMAGLRAEGIEKVFIWRAGYLSGKNSVLDLMNLGTVATGRGKLPQKAAKIKCQQYEIAEHYIHFGGDRPYQTKAVAKCVFNIDGIVKKLKIPMSDDDTPPHSWKKVKTDTTKYKWVGKGYDSVYSIERDKLVIMVIIQPNAVSMAKLATDVSRVIHIILPGKENDVWSRLPWDKLDIGQTKSVRYREFLFRLSLGEEIANQDMTTITVEITKP